MTCCGKTMAREGTKWVCRRCGAWCDPGNAPSPAPQRAR